MEVPKFLNILLLAATIASSEARLSSLRQGSSLTVEKESDFLVSPNGTFSSGFFKVDTNASCYSIQLSGWLTDRDKPVSGRGSKLTLHRNGNLVLTDEVGSIVWSTNTFSDAGVAAWRLSFVRPETWFSSTKKRGSSGRVSILPQIHFCHPSDLSRTQPWWP
ncbi:hypothetical protein CerSpe_225460 [Prunus speciosa]